MYSTAAQADNFNLLSAFNLLQSEEQYAESEKKGQPVFRRLSFNDSPNPE